MKKIIFFIILTLSIAILNVINAQTYEIDSIKSLLKLHVKNDTVKVDLLNKISSKLFRININKAFEYAEESKMLASELNYAQGKAESLRIIGEIYYYKSNYSQSLANSQKALQTFNKINYKRGIALCLNNIGLVYKKKGDYSKALSFYSKALETAQSIEDKTLIMMYSSNIGVVYKTQTNYLKALEYYQKALKLSEKMGDKLSSSICLNNIGNIHYLMNDYPKTIKYYENSLEIYKELNDKTRLIKCLNNLGILYNTTGNYSKAFEYSQKSLEIAEKFDYKSDISQSLQNIGDIYISRKKYNKALEYYLKTLKLNKEIGDKNEISSSYLNVGKIYFITKKYNKALDYTLKSLQIANELELIAEKKDIHYQLSEIFASTKNYKKAYEHHLIYSKLNDSIFNENNIKKITSLELQYKYDKEKQAIKLEQQKKEAVFVEEAKRHKAERKTFIIGFLVALIIILLFMRMIRIKKKANSLLHEKNKEILFQKNQISEQKEELQIKTDELAKHKENLEKKVKQRTLDLFIAKEKAEESDLLKTSFINNISHEFRTPMNAILGFSSFLKKSDLSEENRKEFSSIVDKSCSQLLNIVDDTIEISKVQANQAKLFKTDVNIADIISEVINDFNETLLQKKLEINLDLNLNEAQLFIKTDKNKIKKIFWHLTDNAIKYTQNGYIKITGKLLENNYTEFRIADTGIGISPDMHKKIFEPYRQVETGVTRDFGGNGIGLSLSKAYVEMLGGKIEIESLLDKGTTIIFTIPLEENTKKEKQKKIITSGIKDNKTVLIAEDNKLNYLLLQELLSRYNLNLLHAWNGNEAVEVFRKEKQIDLILMDLKMPIMNGLDATKQIKQLNASVPIVAQTAYSTSEDQDNAKKYGCDDFISKPISEQALHQIINNYLL